MSNTARDSSSAAGTRTKERESDKSRWEEIRQRLDESRTAIESRFEPSEDRKTEILRERAKELARVRVDEADAEDKLQVVEFLLADEKYGIEPGLIRRVFPLKTFTPVPCTPSFIWGITNLRGEILPVVDLKQFFGLSGKGATDLSSVLVLQSGAMQFGILVDSIVGSRSIPLGQIQPASASLAGASEKYIKGITNDALVILDAEKILSDENLVVYEEA